MVELKLPHKRYLHELLLGPCYLSHNPVERWIFRSRLKASLRCIEPVDKCIFLDIGTGGGVLLPSLDRSGQAVGLDIENLAEVKSMLDYEKTKDTHLVQGDVGHLPFKHGVFDCVLCVSVLDHMENPKDALSEMKRVLKPTGKLIVGIATDSPLMVFWNMYAKLIKKWKHSTGHLFSPKEIQGFLEETYTILRAEKVPNFLPRRLSVYIAMLCQPRLIDSTGLDKKSKGR